MKMDKSRKIPMKNYLILGLVFFVTMILLYYFYVWVDVYKESKVNIPIMDKYMTVINYNELDNYVIENPSTIVYVSVLEDENIRNFEKQLKNKYKAKEVEKDLLYMNVTDDIMDNNIRFEMQNNYALNSLNMTDVPCILVFNNGVLTSIYSIKENEYDVDKLVSYINNIKLESDGF